MAFIGNLSQVELIRSHLLGWYQNYAQRPFACTVNSCLGDTLILWTEATCKSPAKTMKKSPLADSLYYGHQMIDLRVPIILGVD